MELLCTKMGNIWSSTYASVVTAGERATAGLETLKQNGRKVVRKQGIAEKDTDRKVYLLHGR